MGISTSRFHLWTLRFVAVGASVHTDADRRSQQNWCFRGVNADRRGCEPTQQPLQTEGSTSGTCSWRCPESPQTSRYDQIIHHNDQLPVRKLNAALRVPRGAHAQKVALVTIWSDRDVCGLSGHLHEQVPLVDTSVCSGCCVGSHRRRSEFTAELVLSGCERRSASV